MIQGDRFSFSGESVVSLKSGQRLVTKHASAFDGTQTVAVDEGNSATVFDGRHEPPAMFPPHCWGIFTLEVNFPLSVYLQGTAALKLHPKVRRYPVARGSLYELYKVESEFSGEETVNGLDCLKVKVRSWPYSNGLPVVGYLWLAKDRNYHVARCQTAWIQGAKEVPGDETRVTKWQEVAKGIWLPAAVESQSFERQVDDKKPSQPRLMRQLVVERATLNPSLPSDFFQLPSIPDSLPKFVIDRNGYLMDGPQHLRPAQADPATTLESILHRIAIEEAKYDQIEVTTTNHYQQGRRIKIVPCGSL